MDCGADYISMCQKAKEIQNHIPLAWDCYLCLHNKKEEVKILSGYETDGGAYGPNVCKEDYCSFWEFKVWLPRQDQLQAMLEDNVTAKEDTRLYKTGANLIVPAFWGWFCRYSNSNIAGSMEQLWLAYVMFEKYEKKWTGTEWE